MEQHADRSNGAWVRRGLAEGTVRDHNQRELNCRTAFVTIIGLESILRISFLSRIITLDHQMDFVPTILIFPMVGKMLRKCGIQSRPKLIKISYEKKKLEWCCPVDAKGRWNAERDQIYTGRGLWREGMRLDCKNCKDSFNCLNVNVAREDDFNNAKIWLQETVESLGDAECECLLVRSSLILLK